MNILEWLLWIGAVVFVGLAIFLVVALFRLSRELKQLGEDTSLATKRLRATLRKIQLVAPAAALVKSMSTKAKGRVDNLRKKEVERGRKEV